MQKNPLLPWQHIILECCRQLHVIQGQYRGNYCSFPVATVVIQMCCSVTLYIHCLSYSDNQKRANAPHLFHCVCVFFVFIFYLPIFLKIKGMKPLDVGLAPRVWHVYHFHHMQLVCFIHILAIISRPVCLTIVV